MADILIAVWAALTLTILVVTMLLMVRGQREIREVHKVVNSHADKLASTAVDLAASNTATADKLAASNADTVARLTDTIQTQQRETE